MRDFVWAIDHNSDALIELLFYLIIILEKNYLRIQTFYFSQIIIVARRKI